MKAVLSIGNPIKTDDNIGNIVLDMIDVVAKKFRGETLPENFIGKMEGCKKIVIIDALQFDGEVGDVKAFKLDEVEDRLTSTHSMPIAMLKKLYPDAEISIIGIRPKSVEFGEDLTIELQNKLETIARKVEEIISSL